jgi:hypothetical protein
MFQITKESIAFYSKCTFWNKQSVLIISEAIKLFRKNYLYLESIPFSHYLFEYSFFKILKDEIIFFAKSTTLVKDEDL